MRFLRVWFGALVDGVSDPDARPLYIAAFGLLSIGTIFYSLVEGWTALDALYFSVTTLTTVGLGDYTPQTGHRQGLHDRLRPRRGLGDPRLHQRGAPAGRQAAAGADGAPPSAAPSPPEREH